MASLTAPQPHHRLHRLRACAALLSPAWFGLLALTPATDAGAAPPGILSFAVDDTRLPVGGQPWLSWRTVGAETVSLRPGIGDVTSFTDEKGSGNGVPPAPVSRFRFVNLNDSWRYLDDGSDLGGTPWQAVSYNDSAWLEGTAPLGYGDPVNTPLEFGPDPEQKFLTYYFRKTFSVTAAQIERSEVLFLELQRDDGAIVYLNGTEIVRDNLPEGDVSGVTRASRATSGDAESEVFRHIVDKNLLRAGDNVLAVGVHQASAASSDMLFDAGLYSVRSTAPVSVVEFNSTWRFLDDGSDLADTGWELGDYDDTAWQEGDGEFGYDSTVEATLLDFGDDPDDKHITYYFRRKFLVGNAGAVRDLYANLLYDDGALVYVNGNPVARVNLPDGPVAADTLALQASQEGVYEELDLRQFVAFLKDGENTIAVEVHQASPGSSDVSFDMELVSVAAGGATTTLIERRSLWRYEDSGADLGPSDQSPASAWFGGAYDDTGWDAGRAELGYGDGNGATAFATLVNYGPDPDNKPLTCYFRRTFALDAEMLGAMESLTLSLQRDDGAIVYLNGTEVVRDNMDEGEIDGVTPALAPSATTTNWSIDKALLQSGSNTLAVEVHQQSPSSSDLYFDLRLTGTRAADSITYTLTATNADGSTSADVTVDYLPVVEGWPLPASPVFLATPHPAGVDWTFAALWSDRQAPRAGQEYIVHGNFASTVRSPEGAVAPDFGGNLTLAGSRSRLVLSHANGTAARIPLLTIRGGTVWHALDDAYLQLGEPGAMVLIEDAATFGHADVSGARLLAIASDLSGTGDVTVAAPPVPDGATATLFLGNGAGFSGDWIIEDTVGAAGHDALGSGNILITGNGALDLDYDYHNPAGTITLQGSASQLVVDHSISVAMLTVRGLDLPPGVYEGAAIEALGQNFVDRGGQLVIAGGDPDQDGDGLLDAWELRNFGSLAQTGTGDFDRDGDSNEREETAGTDPADPASVFRLSVATGLDADGETPLLTLSWPGVATRSYFVQVSENLRDWRVVSLVSGVDGTTFHEDRRNFPSSAGTPPLFYRVVVSGS